MGRTLAECFGEEKERDGIENMKCIRKILLLLLVLICVSTTCFSVLAESVDADDVAGPFQPQASPEETERTDKAECENLIEELYSYWRTYTSTEGDNGFEKAINFIWRYKGDVGGVSAAVAALILALIIIFRYVPATRRYAELTGAAAIQTKKEVMNVLSDELKKYAPALETVELVAGIYPQFTALIDKLVSENAELKELVESVGCYVKETEQRHASAMELQGATFKDMILLSALPAAKKSEILENYRVIELSNSENNGDAVRASEE